MLGEWTQQEGKGLGTERTEDPGRRGAVPLEGARLARLSQGHATPGHVLSQLLLWFSSCFVKLPEKQKVAKSPS